MRTVLSQSFLLSLSLCLVACGARDGLPTPASSSGSSDCAPGDRAITFGRSETGGATFGITTDADGVYWTNSDGSVWKAEHGGLSPKPIATGLGQPSSIAVRANTIFVSDYPNGFSMIDETSGVSTVLLGGYGMVAAGPSGVYATDYSQVFELFGDGTAPQILAPVSAGGASLAADAEYVYAKILAPESGSASIVRIPLSTGGVEEIVTAEPQTTSPGSQELAVDDTHVYWVNHSEGTVMSASKSGGAKVVLASGLTKPGSIAVDRGEVYFTVGGADDGSDADRAVAKVPAAGGPMIYLAQGSMQEPYAIAVDAQFAYWTASSDGPVTAACR